MGRDEDDWNGALFAVQLALQLKAAHARQIDVQDETRSVIQPRGSQEILRRGERFRIASNRSHQALERFADGGIVIHDRYALAQLARCYRFLRALLYNLHLA